MEDNIINQIINLYKENKWREIIDKFHNHSERNKLLWVFPSEENLMFIGDILKENNVDNVLSIGCGSGLLEWVIYKATGIPVQGLEIDGAWWDCKYSPPNFIPLLFAQPTLEEDTITILKQMNCLLFCYFNDRDAFIAYLNYFLGNVLIIIGPDKEKGVHTDPRPFDDIGADWRLTKWQEVRNSKDFIAVYSKDI